MPLDRSLRAVGDEYRKGAFHRDQDAASHHSVNQVPWAALCRGSALVRLQHCSAQTRPGSCLIQRPTHSTGAVPGTGPVLSGDHLFLPAKACHS